MGIRKGKKNCGYDIGIFSLSIFFGVARVFGTYRLCTNASDQRLY